MKKVPSPAGHALSLFKIWFLKRLDFVALVGFLVLKNFPYFQNIYVPRHDTMYGFELFHYFYSSFFFYGEMAQWLVFDSLGLPSNHDQLFGLTPLNYFVMFWGRLLRIEEALLLFKLSMLGEQLICLLGLYLLCHLIFKNKATIFIVCLGVLSNSDLMTQVYFDFRIFYMFPLAVYSLILFFSKRKPQFLWLSGLVVMAWIMGNVLYFICLWFFILSIIAFVFFIKDPGLWRSLFERSFSNIGLLSFLIVLTLSFFYQLVDIQNFVYLVTRGPGGKNALDLFLQWGGVNGLGELLKSLILGESGEYYVGLLPLVFCFWAALKVRSPIFAAFLSALVALLCLSFGGLFAVLFYYFPGLSYYRHIGLVYGLLKLLIMICAGFGLDHFWTQPAKTKILCLSVIFLILVFLIDALRISGEWFTALAFTGEAWKNFIFTMTAHSVFLRAGGYFIVFFILFVICLFDWIKGGRSSHAQEHFLMALLLLSFVLDVGSFQYEIYKKSPRLEPELRPLLYTLKVHPLTFQPMRTIKPLEQRQQDAYALTTRLGGGTKYTSLYEFAQFDVCHAQSNILMFPLGLHQLLSQKNSVDPDLKKLLGCYAPKIRLLTNVIYVDSKAEALAILKYKTNLYEEGILRGVEQEVRRRAARMDRTANLDAAAHVQKFTPNEILFDINVPTPSGAWLVYADSYHPAWSVKIDGKKGTIYEAYLTFKAIWLEQGDHVIHFAFRPGLSQWISYFIFGFGWGVSFLMLGAMGAVLFGFGPKKSCRFYATNSF